MGDSQPELHRPESAQHGAILFRGFAEFRRCRSLNALRPHSVRRCLVNTATLPREELGGKVYGSTPYPADETILFHNESSHMHRWPMLIWFYCVKAATAGGESPLIDCRRIYQSLDHDIREQLRKKRDCCTCATFTDGLDVSWQKFLPHR